MDCTFKNTRVTAEIQYGPPNQQPANTTYKSDEHTTTAADPLSASAKQLAETTAWLTGIAKRKMALESMQRAMTKWAADLDKWQSKIEAVKEELEFSDQQVRKLSEENRAHLEMLAKKEAEFIRTRDELSRLRGQMRDNFGEDVDKFEVVGDHQPPLPPPGFDDM